MVSSYDAHHRGTETQRIFNIIMFSFSVSLCLCGEAVSVHHEDTKASQRLFLCFNHFWDDFVVTIASPSLYLYGLLLFGLG